MSRGPGEAQRAILSALAEHQAMLVSEIAQLLGRSDNQVRTAVRSLETRGLVVVTRGYIGWKGEGEYGIRQWHWANGKVDTKYIGAPVYGMRVWLPEVYDEVRSNLHYVLYTRKRYAYRRLYNRAYQHDPWEDRRVVDAEAAEKAERMLGQAVHNFHL